MSEARGLRMSMRASCRHEVLELDEVRPRARTRLPRRQNSGIRRAVAAGERATRSARRESEQGRFANGAKLRRALFGNLHG